MPQRDRQIPDKEKCPTCSGAGWTWWTPPPPAEGEAPQESKWVVCRECIGTGRSDQKGRKRIKPEESPGG
jgi:DnaJ-class molecular chaperone